MNNIAEEFLNWKDGGNNYILKGDSRNRWVGFRKPVIDNLREKFNSRFNLVIWGTQSEKDFYCIPFDVVEHLFTSDHMTTGKQANEGNERWTAIIENHIFKMHSNIQFSVNVERFYGTKLSANIYGFEDKDILYGVDYTIEDAKANVKVRLGQSGFRKNVLKNFDYKCCITGISEKSLLVASHIVPWARNKNYRSDPANGLCLFVELDSYFDQGYISITREMRVIVSTRISELS